MIPRKPDRRDATGWLSWVNTNYTFEPKWERRLLKRRERPTPGSEEQLNDLRGVRVREIAAELAGLWFHATENSSRIASAIKDGKERDAEKERARLVRIAKLALDGKLGDSPMARDTAQATAQQYLSNMPEFCDDDTLADWEKMHQYAKRVANGEKPSRPRLAADIRAEQARRREMADIHDSIGAAYGG